MLCNLCPSLLSSYNKVLFYQVSYKYYSEFCTFHPNIFPALRSSSSFQCHYQRKHKCQTTSFAYPFSSLQSEIDFKIWKSSVFIPKPTTTHLSAFLNASYVSYYFSTISMDTEKLCFGH